MQQSNQNFQKQLTGDILSVNFKNTSALMDKQFNQNKDWADFQGGALESMGLPKGAWALGASANALPRTTQVVAPGSYSRAQLPGDPTRTALTGSTAQQAFGWGNSTGIGF